MQNTLTEGWGPLAPNEGPPLPRSLGIFWPWYKGEQAPAPVQEYIPREAPVSAPSTVAPITVISQPSAAPPVTPGSTVVPVTIISDVSQAEAPPVAREVAPAAVRYYLYTDVIGEGKTIPTSGRSYDSGSTVEVTAVPYTGWTFDHWEGDAYGTNTVTKVRMDTDKSVVAVFAQIGAPSVPTAPEVPTTPELPSDLPPITPTPGEIPDNPVVGMFSAPSLSLPSQVTLGDTLKGSASFPTMWPSSLPTPPSLPAYPVTASVVLVGSEYTIGYTATSFTPGQAVSVPINYNTSGLPKAGTYSVRARLLDSRGIKFVDGIVGSLKVLAPPLPEAPPAPSGGRVIIELDPADASKGYAYAEPSKSSYDLGEVVKITAVAKYPAKLDHWTVNGIYKPGGTLNYTVLLPPMTGLDVTVKAFFK